jgi:hypothetical protein
MNKNTTMFLGLLLVGGAAYYFISSTKDDSKNNKGADDGSYTPKDTAQTQSKTIKVASTVAQALKDNENAFIYNGKIVWLNALLQVSKFQLIIDRYTLNSLALLYTKLKGKTIAVADLPYGEPNKGNIDRYIQDRLTAPASVKKYFTN